MISDSFDKDFASACVDAGIGTLDHIRLFKEIRELIKLDALTTYYIATQPLPGFPRTKLDLFLLTESFIYNYEITEDNDIWSIVPLSNISHMRESRWSTDDYWALNILVKSSSDQQGALVVIDKLDNRAKLRKFLGALRDEMLEVSTTIQ